MGQVRINRVNEINSDESRFIRALPRGSVVHNPYMGTPRENSTGRPKKVFFAYAGGFLALHHAHHGRAQHALVYLPAMLKDLRHIPC